MAIGVPICARQIDPDSANFGGEKENEYVRVVVKVIDQSRPDTHDRRPVHPMVRHPSILDGALNDV